jgi:hypothetical protein
MANITMQDVRAKFPQYNDMSDDQLASALHQKFYADMPQDQFYSQIGYTPKPAAPATPPEDPQNMSFGKQLLGNAELAGSAIGNIPHGIAHAVSDLYHRLSGDPNAKDPNWINAIHVPTGQAGQELAQGLGDSLTSTIDAAGGQAAATRAVVATNEYMTGEPKSGTQAVVQSTLPAVGDIATLAGAKGIPGAVRGAVGDVANAARGVREAVSGNGFDMPEEPTPADVGLKAPSTPPLKPHQQVGNTISGAEASVPKGTPLSPEALAEARKAPGAVMGRVAAATPDGPMSADELAQLDGIGGSGVPVSGQGSIANIEGLRGNLKTILGADGVTGRQKVDWLQALRTKGYKNSASIDPGAQELGDAQLDAANVLESHIERSLPKDADVDIDQFRAARTALAKNHTVEATLKGGNIDMAALGRMFQRNPNLLTGGLGMLGRFASENPELVGMGNRFQESLSDVANGVDLTKPATWLKPVTGAVSRIKANREAASGVEAAQRAFPGAPPEKFAPIDRTPQPPPGMTAGPMGSPPAPGGPGGDFSLADVLSHGVEQSPPAGLSLAPMEAPKPQGVPFTRNAAHEAGDLSLADPDSWFKGGAPKGLGDDIAGVMSQGVPEGTLARTPPRAGGPRLGDMLSAPDAPEVKLSVPEGKAFELGQRDLFQGPRGTGKPSPAGTLKTQPGMKDNEVQIVESALPKEMRGKGLGVQMYQDLADSTHAKGKVLVSDTRVSEPAQRMYAALKRRGYDVRRNPAEKQGSGELVSYGDRPVFEVHPPKDEGGLGDLLAAQ